MESDERTSKGSEDVLDNDKSIITEETSMASNENGTETLKQESSDGQVVNANESHKRWSTLLQSPRGTECFSPSLDLSRPDSLHGIGMRLASSKSRSIGEVAHKVLLFFTEIANLYDQVGLIGFKCLQELQPSQETLFPEVLQAESNELKITLEYYSMSTRQLAEYIRVTILTALEDSLTSNGTIVTNSNNRYSQVRQLCRETRSKALSARKAYLKAVKNAEYSFESWKKARETTAPLLAVDFDKITDEMECWEKALMNLGANVPSNTASLIQLLKTAKSCEMKYRDLVAKENKLIDEAQAVEVLGLDEIQSVVDSRLEFFVNSVGRRMMVFDKDSIEKTAVVPVEGKSPNALQSALQEKKIDGAMFLNNLFKQQNFRYEEGKGVMEADALGLSQETGELRDKIQSAFATRSSRIKVAQTLRTFLYEFASENSKFSKSMKTKTQTGKLNPTEAESLQDVVMNNIGTNSVDLIEGILRALQTEATAALECVDELNKIARTKLDPFLASAPQKLEAIVSAEDSDWKQLCEASRSESKADNRYNQLKSQLERGRDRMSSTDSRNSSIGTLDYDSASGDDSDEKPVGTPSRISKIGSMLAGNDAIKKLQENAMNTITKLKDEKIGKERQALAEASAIKDDVLAKYLSNTKLRLFQLETEDSDEWEELRSALDSIVSTVAKLLECRQSARKSKHMDEFSFTTDQLLEDVEDWLDSSKTKIIEAEQDGLKMSSSNAGAETGYALSVVEAESKPVEILLKLNGDEEDIATLDIGKIVWPEEPKENEDASHNVVETQDNDDQSEDSHTKSSGRRALHRSLTTPVDSTNQRFSDGVKQAAMSFDDSKADGDAETKLRQSFVKAFWSQKDVEPPAILQTIPCTYRAKEKGSFLIQPVQGRVYSTADSIYFLALDGKKLSLPWAKVTGIEVEKGILGSSENSVAISYKLEPEANEFAFVLGRLESRDAALAHFLELQSGKQSETAKTDEPAGSDANSSSVVPPDLTIKRMETVLSRSIKGVSIKNVYDKVWSEGIKTSEKPFYAPWLKTEGCFELQLGDWEFAEDGKGFVNPWDKESYQQKRLIKFKFKRTTHLYIGPPIANVVQKQYCRVENNDRCIVAMCVSFVGIPYADTFSVEVRWIASRQGSNDVKVEVGLFVDFKKRTMLSSKIETGTITETKSVHNRLFEAVKKACTVGHTGVGDSDPEQEMAEEENVEVESTPNSSILELPLLQKIAISVACPVIAYAFFRLAFGRSGSALGGSDLSLLIGKIDSLQRDVETLQKTVDALTILLKENR